MFVTRLLNRIRSARRGQAMVEFALVLPLLVLLLVLAIDFGRVFFGHVALENASRIAANHSAQNPQAWSGAGDPALQAEYRNEVLRDMQAINCAPPGGGAWAVADIPNPVFTSTGGTADPYEIGDHTTVTLDCQFSFVTPIASLILGNPMPLTAQSDFPVRGGKIDGVPVGPAPPPAPSCVDAIVPNMVGLSVSGARSAWDTAGFSLANFVPASGQDTETVVSQVTNPASIPGDCIDVTASVTVTSAAPSGCTSPDVAVPNLIGLTVLGARDTWDDDFTGSFTPASGFDAELVDGQSLTPGSCKPPTSSITVTHSAAPPPPPPTCTMPDLTGKKVSVASGLFTTAGFTGSFTATPGQPADYKVATQSLVGGQPYPCSSSVTVGPKP